MLHELMWAYQSVFSRLSGGAEDEVLRNIVDKNLCHWMANPGFREWWQTETKTPFTDEFEALVDEVCSRMENVHA